VVRAPPPPPLSCPATFDVFNSSFPTAYISLPLLITPYKNLTFYVIPFERKKKTLHCRYGQEGQVLPRDGGPTPSREPEENEDGGPVERDTVVVMDADGDPTAEQVVLRLILARAKLAVVVKDTSAAKNGFGPYASPVDGGDKRRVARALKGAAAVVCCGKGEGLAAAAAAAGVPHLVLLSSVGLASSGFSFFGPSGEQRVLGDARREQEVSASGVPYTVVRVGALRDIPGGTTQLEVAPGGAPSGTLCREDAATVLAQASLRDPKTGSLVVSVAPAGPGEPGEVDWAEVAEGSRTAAL
jgi:hypothetical protein